AGSAEDRRVVTPHAAQATQPSDRSPVPQAISPPAVAPASIYAPKAAWVESALASPGALWPLLATLFAAVVVQSASLNAFFYEDDYLHLFGLANGPTIAAL